MSAFVALRRDPVEDAFDLCLKLWRQPPCRSWCRTVDREARRALEHVGMLGNDLAQFIDRLGAFDLAANVLQSFRRETCPRGRSRRLRCPQRIAVIITERPEFRLRRRQAVVEDLDLL